jgi:hypothetical protein
MRGGCLTGLKWKKEGEAARLREENFSSLSSTYIPSRPMAANCRPCKQSPIVNKLVNVFVASKGGSGGQDLTATYKKIYCE